MRVSTEFAVCTWFERIKNLYIVSSNGEFVMNIFGALIPCALQRGCWSSDERMTGRMGAATSTPPGDMPPPHPPNMSSSPSDQLSVVVR